MSARTVRRPCPGSLGQAFDGQSGPPLGVRGFPPVQGTGLRWPGGRSGHDGGGPQGLPAAERSALVALLDRASTAVDHPALPEPQFLAVTRHAEAPPGERIVLVRYQTELLGFAVLSPARDGSTVVHVVVDPAVATPQHDVDTALLRLAVEEAPAGSDIHLWVMQATPADDARVAAGVSPPSATSSRCASPSPCPTTWSPPPVTCPPGRSWSAATRRRG